MIGNLNVIGAEGFVKEIRVFVESEFDEETKHFTFDIDIQRIDKISGGGNPHTGYRKFLIISSTCYYLIMDY